LKAIKEQQANNKIDLLTRRMVMEHRPCDRLTFSDCIAGEPYSALIIGFGRLGKSWLKQLIQNSQFLTQNNELPHFIVVDSNPLQFEKFMASCPEIDRCAKINFVECDVFSENFTDLVKSENVQNVKHVVNTLSDKRIRQLLERTTFDTVIPSENFDLAYGLDKEAIELNYMFQSEEVRQEKSKDQVWSETIEFHRESARASCAFMPAMQKISGVQAKEIANLPDEKLVKLGQIEHLRWNAFYFSHGYTQMPLDKFKQNVAKGITKPVRDFDALQHACLVSWDELNELDKIAGDPAHTQQGKDIAIVKMISTLARLEAAN
jgi:hypothetical protein